MLKMDELKDESHVVNMRKRERMCEGGRGGGATCVRANGWDTGLTRIWRSLPFRSELSILSKWASTQKILQKASDPQRLLYPLTHIFVIFGR